LEFPEPLPKKVRRDGVMPQSGDDIRDPVANELIIIDYQNTCHQTSTFSDSYS